MTIQNSTVDIVSEFRNAMREHGIEITSEIIPDGRIHRAHAEGDKPRTRKAWYVLHIDGGTPAGVFGHYRLMGGEKGVKWSLKGALRLDREQRRKLAQQARALAKARAEETAAAQRAAAERAVSIWETADPVEVHPYLERKKVKAHGIRVGRWEVIDRSTGEIKVIAERALLVPIRDKKRQIVSLQAIFSQKPAGWTRDKDFLADGRKSGCWHTIGKPTTKPYTFIFAEGYATAASIHEATGHCVVTCFDAGNLQPVAAEFRAAYPDATFLFAADNDAWTRDRNGQPSNPGVDAARAAAKALGGLVAVPDFLDVTDKPTDFNDLAAMQGLSEVAEQILLALSPPADHAPPAADADPGMPDEYPDEVYSPPNPYFTALGYDHEVYYLFSHEKRQVMPITRADMSEAGLVEFAPVNWWEQNFPANSGKAAFDRMSALNWLIRLCMRRGIYDPGRIRGRGAWVDSGRMVFHFGDKLVVDGAATDIERMNSRYVYELAISLPPAAEQTASVDDCRRLIEISKLFRWEKPASAALLCGWVALAPVCGALRWRPHVWLTGGSGSGKTTIVNSFIHPMLNGISIYAMGNSTEAGIRQKLKSDALPVVIDESEAHEEADKKRIQSLLTMIRQASSESGAQTFKGSTNGDSLSFHVRSMFALASINVSMKQQADLERITILNLRSKRDEKDGAENWKKISDMLYSVIERDKDFPSRLFRRTMDLLPITRKNIVTFAEAAAKRFGSQRDGDQYGTLMAGYWSLISDKAATMHEAVATIDAFDWSAHAEYMDQDESMKALYAILGAQIRIDGGRSISVSELVALATNKIVPGFEMGSEVASQHLIRNGMKVASGYLHLANTSPHIRALLSDTPYETDWRGQVQRVAGVVKSKSNVRFNALVSKALLVPLALCDIGTPDREPGEDDDIPY